MFNTINRNKYINNKGFTLVELLVVIAIIGILSSVAVVNLNTARDKAKDAKAMQELSSAHVTAQLNFDSNDGAYSAVCTDIGSFQTACVETASAWAASITLSDGYFCVDSTGAAKKTATVVISTVCPA